MSYTALSIYNFISQAATTQPPKELVSSEKTALISDIALAVLLIVAAVVLLVLEQTGVNMGLVGTIASSTAGGIAILICGADLIAFVILRTCRAEEELENHDTETQLFFINKAHSETIKELEKQIEKGARTKQKLKQEIDTQSKVIGKLVLSAEQQKQQLEEANQNIDALNHDNTVKKVEIDAQAIVIEKLVLKAEQQKTVFASTQQELEQANERVESLRKSLDSQAATIQQMNVELEKNKENEELVKSSMRAIKAQSEAEKKWEAASKLNAMPRNLWPQLKKLEAGYALPVKSQSPLEEVSVNKVVKYDVYYYDGTYFSVHKNIELTRILNKDTDPLLKKMKLFGGKK